MADVIENVIIKFSLVLGCLFDRIPGVVCVFVYFVCCVCLIWFIYSLLKHSSMVFDLLNLSNFFIIITNYIKQPSKWIKCPKNPRIFLLHLSVLCKIFPEQLILNSTQQKQKNRKEFLQLKRLKEQKLIEMFFKLMEKQMRNLSFDETV